MIGKCNTGGENVTPEVTTQTPIIQNITEALVGKAQGANATAEQILKGYSAYVGQKLVNGTAKDASTMVDLLGIFGCTKIAIDKFTFTSRVDATSRIIQHSLGKRPNIAILTCASNPTKNNSVCDIFVRNRPSSDSSYWLKGVLEVIYTTYQGGVNITTMNVSTLNVTETTFLISAGSTAYYDANIEYTLITMA